MEELLKNVKFGDKFCASNGQCALYLYSEDDETGKIYFFAAGNGLNVEEVEFIEVDCKGKCKSEMNNLEIVSVWDLGNELPIVPNTQGKLFENLRFGDIFKAADNRLSVYIGVNEADEKFPYSFLADANEFEDLSANENGETLVASPMGCCGKKGANIIEKIS